MSTGVFHRVTHFYKLEGKIAIPVDDNEYHWWVLNDPEHGHRVVKQDEFDGGTILVSTVFMFGINHQFRKGNPLLFETMILGGPLDQYQVRYSTWEESEAGHEEALKELFQQMPELTPPYTTRFERILKDD